MSVRQQRSRGPSFNRNLDSVVYDEAFRSNMNNDSATWTLVSQIVALSIEPQDRGLVLETTDCIGFGKLLITLRSVV